MDYLRWECEVNVANPKHVEMIRRGVKTWNAWYDLNHVKLAWKIDLSGADLSDMGKGSHALRA